MRSQKLVLFLCVGACILSLMVVFWVGILLGAKQAVAGSVSQAQDTLLLKAYQGKVALYEPPAESPKEVYDIYLSTLPELDQKRLTQGIFVQDQDELNLYLEDFDS